MHRLSHCAKALARPPDISCNPHDATLQGLHTMGLGSSPFARRYLGNLVFDFFSYRYLDGSVPCVYLPAAMYSLQGDRDLHGRVTPFGYPRIIGCVLLPEAFRSLPRPSSSDSSKASTVDPFSLDHISCNPSLYLSGLHLLMHAPSTFPVPRLFPLYGSVFCAPTGDLFVKEQCSRLGNLP